MRGLANAIPAARLRPAARDQRGDRDRTAEAPDLAKELKGLLISITPRNTPTELIAHILGFVGFDPPQELSKEERKLTLTECRDPTRARLIYVCIYVYLQPA